MVDVKFPLPVYRKKEGFQIRTFELFKLFPVGDNGLLFLSKWLCSYLPRDNDLTSLDLLLFLSLSHTQTHTGSSNNIDYVECVCHFNRD